MGNANLEILRGDPKTSLWKLSIPIMVTMIVTSLYNVIDGMWVVGLGQSAIAGIGLVTPLWMIINGVGTGLGNGATSSISRLREEFGDEKANIAASQSIVIFVAASVLLSVVLLVVLIPFLSIYNPNSETFNQAIDYSVPLFIGLFGFILSCGFTGVLRAEGDTKRAMYANSLGIILNAVFDPIFIYVFKWGAAGASISTVVTSLLSAVILGYWIFVKKDTYCRIHIRDLFKSKWDWSITKDILNTGIPASAVLFSLALASFIFYYFINIVSGDLGTGVFASGNRIYLLGIMPISSMCSALVAIIGTHYGAGNFEYVKRTHRYCSLYSTVVGMVVCSLFVIFSKQLAMVFVFTSNDPQLLDGIAQFISITAFCIPFLGIGLPSTYLYQGLGKGIYSFIWTSLYDLGTVVPAVYLFAFQLNFGLLGVWYGFLVGRAIASTANFIFANYSINKLIKTGENNGN